ncbi:MAG TPA: hypothetical protein VGF55_29965, partial [Gemmataceae bacterium]
AVAAALRRVGVQTPDKPPPDGRDVAHWLEALPLRRDPASPPLTDQTPVLFELPERPASGYPANLAPLVGEMLRLGNDRQAFRLASRRVGRTSGAREAHRAEAVSESVGLGRSAPSTHPTDSALLRVIGPPYYSLLRAIDRLGPDAPRAYLERAPRVWVEVGWTHPLVGQLKAPDGQLLLLRPPHEWAAVEDAPFRDVYEVLQFQLPGQPVTWTDTPPAGKLTVPLRLAAGTANEPAELWVLRGDAVEQIDALVRDADDRLLARLSFAVGDQAGERVAVLRARPGKGGPPVLVVENALACRTDLRLPNLYLPVGQRLRPPLRRDAVRRLLADDADRVVWLVPADGDGFVPQSLPEAAFRPLSDWVEYVLDRDAAALTAWAEAARFEFGSYVSREDLVAAPRPPQGRERKPRGAAAAVTEAARPKVAPKPKKPDEPVAPLEDAFVNRPAATPSELQVRLKGAEEQFLAVDGPLDDPRRLALWPELARLNGLLGHKADASLAWANTLWEPADPPPTWAWGWVEAEQALPKPDLTAADLDRLLANDQPAAPDVRPLAAAVVWAARQKPVPAELRKRLPEVQRYLERHDHLLPVRVVWLAWYGLACHFAPGESPGANYDVLTLARTRDRLLERLLAEGLGAERDLPGFLRFAGQREGDRLRTVRERAERLRQLAHQWSGFPVADGLQQTSSYIDLLFAFGFARLGEAGQARALTKRAAAALEAAGSEAHAFLAEAFRYRIDQVLAGKPHAGPLPAEQLEYLDQMRREADALSREDTDRRLAPYVVERLRKESSVLEPQEKFEPYRLVRLEQDELLAELARLPDVRDRRQLGERLARLVDKAAAGKLPETRLRVLAEALMLAPRVGDELSGRVLAQVGPALDAVPPAPDPTVLAGEAVLLERAIFFAGHADRPELVQAFADRLGRLLAAPAGRAVLEPVGQLVGQTFRSLRKLGLKDTTDRLMQQIAAAALGGQSVEEAQARAGRDWPETLRLLLHLAGGWLYFDRPDQARPILDAARGLILGGGRPADRPSPLTYVALVATYVAAVGQAPLDEALGRIEELFTSGRMDRLPNTYTTNKFYSRFHLTVVEAVVLALANEDFALGPAARRWLDDDEYLVRRRIHRDVRAALARAGM